MKHLIDLLDAKTNFCGWAKPCRIYINQAFRDAVVVMSKGDSFNVAYQIPKGRTYVKKITAKESNILKIDWNKSFNDDGTTFTAYGF